ncbi:MAG: trypsin-like peptidase domain-containing protein [Planctomycetes bacterium]|nr:trypsin-like peptidase domain-containing protein [Planctomycetota bacterium]
MNSRSFARPPRTGRFGVAAVLLALGCAVRAPAQPPDRSGLFAIQQDLVQLVDKLTPAVVRVAARYTGVIVDGRGYVLSDVAAVPAQFGADLRIPVELASGRIVDAQPIWRAEKSRTALLKILKGARYPHIPAGDSDALAVGALALTIGNAFNQASQGGQPAVTVGHIAGLEAAGAGAGIAVGTIITTAAINPGTSGGPLIDAAGSIIGINDQRRGSGDMGLVMPINFVRESYAGCEEAYRVLSLGAQKPIGARRHIGFMDRAVVRAAQSANRSIASLVIERAAASGAPAGGAPVAQAEKAAPEEKDGPEGDPGDPESAAPPAAPKATPDEPLRPPPKERNDGLKPLPPPRQPAPAPREGGQRPPSPPPVKVDRRDGPVTGVVISPDGLILTAQDNLWETADQKIQRIEVILPDGRKLEATRLGTDRMRGLALLRVATTDLATLPEAGRDEVEIGSFVAVVANPYGTQRYKQEPFLTWGMLSARNQLDPAKSAYQTDAWVNQANQGGALIDMEGRLLGITLLHNPARYGLNSGIGFAIPMWAIRPVLDRLARGEEVHAGYLGVRLAPVFEPEIHGVRVVEVVRHSPADRGGLQAGDRVLSVNGFSPADMLELLAELAGLCDGDAVALEIERSGTTHRLTIPAERRGP